MFLRSFTGLTADTGVQQLFWVCRKVARVKGHIPQCHTTQQPYTQWLDLMRRTREPKLLRCYLEPRLWITCSKSKDKIRKKKIWDEAPGQQAAAAAVAKVQVSERRGWTLELKSIPSTLTPAGTDGTEKSEHLHLPPTGRPHEAPHQLPVPKVALGLRNSSCMSKWTPVRREEEGERAAQ